MQNNQCSVKILMNADNWVKLKNWISCVLLWTEMCLIFHYDFANSLLVINFDKSRFSTRKILKIDVKY